MLRLTSLCKGLQTATLEAFDQHLALPLHILQVVEQMRLQSYYPFALLSYLLHIHRRRHLSFIFGQKFLIILLDDFSQVRLFLLRMHPA